MPDEKTVFISYANVDTTLAQHLASALARKNFAVTTTSVPQQGTDFISSIEKALAASANIVLLVSNKYLDSKWSNFERAIALKTSQQTNSRLIPVVIDKISIERLPLQWDKLQVVQAIGGADDVVQKVTERLADSQ